MTPLTTVGIALYNHEHYIKECIDSILAQTYDNIQIIVIDDGSKDQSYAVAKTVLESQTVRPYQIITRPNRGMCNTLNEIISLAKGEYISFIGSDDFWHPERIAKQVAYMGSHPEIALVHTDSYIVDGESKITSYFSCKGRKNEGNLYEALIMGDGLINTPAHLYRTSVYDKIGVYDSKFRWEDTDFWLRLSKNFEVGYIPEALNYYRRHGENLSSEDNALKFVNEEIIRIYKKNIDDPALLKKGLGKIYRKSYLKAFRKLKFGYFIKYFSRYLRCRFGVCQ
jgi:glycosyltransferase involved in cell wall biosynthesis